MEHRHIKLVEREIRRINRLFIKDVLKAEFNMGNYESVMDYGFTPMYVAQVTLEGLEDSFPGRLIDMISQFCSRNFMSYQVRLTPNKTIFIEIS